METNRRGEQTRPPYGTMEPPLPSPLVHPGFHYECQEESLHSCGTWQIHTSLEAGWGWGLHGSTRLQRGMATLRAGVEVPRGLGDRVSSILPTLALCHQLVPSRSHPRLQEFLPSSGILQSESQDVNRNSGSLF